MVDIKSLLKDVTHKMVKAQTPKPEVVKRVEKVAEAAKEAAKTEKRSAG